MKQVNIKIRTHGLFHKGKNMFKYGIVLVITMMVMACGAGSGDLSTGEPLNDALARFNMAIHSSDEAAALEIVTEDEREILSQDGFTFAEKYRKGVHRLRLSTLMNNKELSLDSDGNIVGMLKAIEDAHARGRRHKFQKRAGLSQIFEDEKEPLQELSADPAEGSSASSEAAAEMAPVEEAPIADAPEASNAPEASEVPEAAATTTEVEAPEEPSSMETTTEAAPAESAVEESAASTEEVAPSPEAEPEAAPAESDDGFVDS